MELNQLKQFQVVANYENISRAAEELYISQPSLTRSMYNLESDLGVSLLERRKNKIRLNDCGKYLLKQVNTILNDVEMLKKMASEFTDRNSVLNVYSFMPSSLRYFMRLYMENNPKYNIISKTIDDTLMENAILSGKADVAICSSVIKNNEIYQIPYYTFEMELTVPQAHPLAQKKEVDFSDLDGQSFIFPDGPESIAKREIVKKLSLNFKHPDIIIEEDFVLFTEMLKTGNYLAFTSPFSATYHNKNRVIIPFKGRDFKFTLYITYLKKNAFKVEHFVNRMTENYTELILAIQ